MPWRMEEILARRVAAGAGVWGKPQYQNRTCLSIHDGKESDDWPKNMERSGKFVKSVPRC